MKKIIYKIYQGVGRNGEDILFDVELGYSTENLHIAQLEAYNGEYTVEDDCTPEPETEQTVEERLDELSDAIERGLTE